MWLPAESACRRHTSEPVPAQDATPSAGERPPARQNICSKSPQRKCSPEMVSVTGAPCSARRGAKPASRTGSTKSNACPVGAKSTPFSANATAAGPGAAARGAAQWYPRGAAQLAGTPTPPAPKRQRAAGSQCPEGTTRSSTTTVPPAAGPREGRMPATAGGAYTSRASAPSPRADCTATCARRGAGSGGRANSRPSLARTAAATRTPSTRTCAGGASVVRRS